MKNLVLTIVLVLAGMAAYGQDGCKCVYPLKENLSWCTGHRGGIYCINKKGGKTYRPRAVATTVQVPNKQAIGKPKFSMR